MSTSRNKGEEEFRQAVQAELGSQPLPPKAQVKLEEAYASLRSIPQEKSKRCPSPPKQPGTCTEPAQTTTRGKVVKIGKRLVKRSVVIAAAAAFVVLLGGTAFAASSLLQMKEGSVPFFESGSNLAIYNSLQAGVSTLNARVGDVAEVNGMTVTLDTVSTDRNIVNLIFTLEKEGGFDVASASMYEGSNEHKWTRLQNILPRFTQAQIMSEGESLCTNEVSVLDAYSEDGKITCLMRVVPSVVLPDNVTMRLSALDIEDAQTNPCVLFDVGLDLSTVAQPDELGAQDIVFSTDEGEKTLSIKRFTRSELGTVFVVRNDHVKTSGEDGRPLYQPADSAILPSRLKIVDDKNNTLQFVDAGDGGGYNPSSDYVLELAGMAKDAQSVTFTPMTLTEATQEAQPSDAVNQREVLNAQNSLQEIDASRIGTQLATTEYGGFEITDWKVEDNTVSISLKPYGWTSFGYAGSFELIPRDQVTLLSSKTTDPNTGEVLIGQHSGVSWSKYDYETGELMQMISYYAATTDELSNARTYVYPTQFGCYNEEASAAQTLTFKVQP